MIKLLFMGTPHFAATALQTLLKTSDIEIGAVVTQQDRPAGRGMQLTPSAVKSIALASNLHVLQPQSVKKNLDDFLIQVSEFGPFDLGVVVAFGQILPLELLTFPSHGCINLHASALPRWRGAAPIQRAILAGDTETGVDVMRMEEGLDTGGVFASVRTPISPNDTGATLHDRLAELGAKLLATTIPQIIAGKLQPIAQDDTKATYAKKITRQDTVINWKNSANEIERQIRAFHPKPGAVTFLRGQRLKVLHAEIGASEHPSSHSAGSLVLQTRDTIEIQTGQGTLMIDKVQLEGKREMSIREFLAGTPLSIGEMFHE